MHYIVSARGFRHDGSVVQADFVVNTHTKKQAREVARTLLEMRKQQDRLKRVTIDSID